MGARIQWWGRSEGQPEGYGFLLQRARSLACSPHDLPLGRATREERLRALTRAELRTGSFQCSRLMLMPLRIVEAVDGNPEVPPSGLHVRRCGEVARGLTIPWPKEIRDLVRAELQEAKRFRESRWDDLTEDERTIAAEVREQQLGTWANVFAR